MTGQEALGSAMEEEARELAQAVLQEAKEVMDGLEGRKDSEGTVQNGASMRLAQAVPRRSLVRKRSEFLKELAACCGSLRTIGVALAWSLLNAADFDADGNGLGQIWHCIHGLASPLTALHRERGKKSRALFPIPTRRESAMQDAALRLELNDFKDFCRKAGAEEEAWIFTVLCGLNGVAGFGRAPRNGTMSLAQRRAADNVQQGTRRMLTSDVILARSPADAEKELSSRFLSYTGEEVPKMQTIGYEQVLAALPPESHGGSIDAVQLCCEGTQQFLKYPEDALIDKPSTTLKLQARVHVKEGEKLKLAEMLVKRRICVWVPESEVLRVHGKKVLNGMFAVGKGSFLPSGEEIQRLIMNLIPTNSVFKQAQGATSDLPAITQYLGLVLSQDQQLTFYQSDMSSAFYLFRIPPADVL